MFRGTTPILSFKIKDVKDLSSVVDDIWITLKNKDKIVINKTFKDNEVELDENIASIKLSEQETLDFKPREEIRVQMKIKFADKTISASPIFTTTIDNILNPAPMNEDTLGG